MSVEFQAVLRVARSRVQQVFQGLIVVAALILASATLAATLGLTPWPEIPLSFGGKPLPDAGMWCQIILTLLALALCFTLPANTRMARLEHSHRSFAMGMQDVAQAYRMAHTADRKGFFALSGEFDALRSRLESLANTPISPISNPNSCNSPRR